MSEALLKVAELSKFGFKDSTGEYVNWGKFVSEKDKASVVPGVSFKADLFISEKGKKYLNKVLEMVETKPEAKLEPKPQPKPKPRVETKTDSSMSKEEWAAKDQRISRQGVIQVAVQVTSDFDAAVELANKMLGFVNEVK